MKIPLKSSLDFLAYVGNSYQHFIVARLNKVKRRRHGGLTELPIKKTQHQHRPPTKKQDNQQQQHQHRPPTKKTQDSLQQQEPTRKRASSFELPSAKKQNGQQQQEPKLLPTRKRAASCEDVEDMPSAKKQNGQQRQQQPIVVEEPPTLMATIGKRERKPNVRFNRFEDAASTKSVGVPKPPPSVSPFRENEQFNVPISYLDANKSDSEIVVKYGRVTLTGRKLQGNKYEVNIYSNDPSNPQSKIGGFLKNQLVSFRDGFPVNGRFMDQRHWLQYLQNKFSITNGIRP